MEQSIYRQLTDATVVIWQLGIEPDMITDLSTYLGVSLFRDTVGQC